MRSDISSRSHSSFFIIIIMAARCSVLLFRLILIFRTASNSIYKSSKLSCLQGIRTFAAICLRVRCLCTRRWNRWGPQKNGQPIFTIFCCATSAEMLAIYKNKTKIGRSTSARRTHGKLYLMPPIQVIAASNKKKYFEYKILISLLIVLCVDWCPLDRLI